MCIGKPPPPIHSPTTSPIHYPYHFFVVDLCYNVSPFYLTLTQYLSNKTGPEGVLFRGKQVFFREKPIYALVGHFIFYLPYFPLGLVNIYWNICTI